MAITPHSPLKSTDVSEEHKASSEKLLPCCLLDDGSLLGLYYIPEDGGDMILRGVDIQRTRRELLPDKILIGEQKATWRYFAVLLQRYLLPLCITN
jgi:hypothetical protein